ncbi:hypothetical protein IPA_08030 [Ignicoccus pacificus DSM 13166]|uniref:Uncharacterized protein n=1 Tax=Ignicoccus pacificus DSM 13166 TaxID=940294 RepID=A0A977KBT3_9CREN|nr:hypothetical protein IPA_08030 [Ignicoccus pacificus DSM 13166]
MKLVSIVGDSPTGPLEVLEYLYRKGEEPTRLVIVFPKDKAKIAEIVELAILVGIKDVIPTTLLIDRVILEKSDADNKVELQDMKDTIDANVDPGDFVDISGAPKLPAALGAVVARDKEAHLVYVPQAEEKEEVMKAYEELGKMDLKKAIAEFRASGKIDEELRKLLEKVVLKKPKVIIL